MSLDAADTRLNMENRNEITTVCENAINESSDNSSCSSTIKDEPLLIPQSKRFKINSSIRKHKCETCKGVVLNRGNMMLHDATPFFNRFRE